MHEKRAEITEKAVNGYIVTKDTISAALAKIAFAEPTDGGADLMRDRRQALMDLAKLHGHIIDRKDVRRVTRFEDLDDEELRALARNAPPTIEGESEEIPDDDEKPR